MHPGWYAITAAVLVAEGDVRVGERGYAGEGRQEWLREVDDEVELCGESAKRWVGGKWTDRATHCEKLCCWCMGSEAQSYRTKGEIGVRAGHLGYSVWRERRG